MNRLDALLTRHQPWPRIQPTPPRPQLAALVAAAVERHAIRTGSGGRS